MLRRGWFCVAILVAAAAHAQDASPTRDALSSHAVFAELRQQWARNLHDKRIDAAVQEYAPDATFLQPDGSRVHGSEALHKLFEMVTTTYDSALVFDSQRVEVSGDLAYDSGTYRETLILRASGKRQTSSGSYLTIYRRAAKGAWLVVEQAWTGTVQ